MNIEVHSQRIINHKSHKFLFNQQVLHAMFGFSDIFIFYPEMHHHVKEIEIDLTKFSILGNQIIITPHLRMIDSTNHSESDESSITVVVVAIVGPGNINAILVSRLFSHPRFLNDKNSIIKSTIIYSKVQYKYIDHHVSRYMINYHTYEKYHILTIYEDSIIKDIWNSKAEITPMFGSLFCYLGNDGDVLCSDFDSVKIGQKGKITFGKLPDGYFPEDYELACFINGYDLTFDIENHLRGFNVSIKIEGKPFLEGDQLCVNVVLKSYISKNNIIQRNIPQNSVKGFIIAINAKHCIKNQFETLEEYANEYNRLNSEYFNHPETKEIPLKSLKCQYKYRSLIFPPQLLTH